MSQFSFNPYDSDTWPEVSEDPQSTFLDHEPRVPYGTKLQSKRPKGFQQGKVVFQLPDGAQPLPPGAKGPNFYPNADLVPPPQIPPGMIFPPDYSEYSTETDTETESECDPPSVATDPQEPAVLLTDIKNIRQILATRVGFNGGQLGTHLKSVEGLIVLPLHAVSILRIPHGRHVGNPPCLIFHPTERLENYNHLPQFQESINILYNHPSKE